MCTGVLCICSTTDVRKQQKHTNHLHTYCSVYFTIKQSGTELGYVAPDTKIVTTRAIKWRRSTSEPDEKSTLKGLQCMCDSNPE